MIVAIEIGKLNFQYYFLFRFRDPSGKRPSLRRYRHLLAGNRGDKLGNFKIKQIRVIIHAMACALLALLRRLQRNVIFDHGMVLLVVTRYQLGTKYKMTKEEGGVFLRYLC